jgi:hypothetical protein
LKHKIETMASGIARLEALKEGDCNEDHPGQQMIRAMLFSEKGLDHWFPERNFLWNFCGGEEEDGEAKEGEGKEGEAKEGGGEKDEGISSERMEAKKAKLSEQRQKDMVKAQESKFQRDLLKSLVKYNYSWLLEGICGGGNRMGGRVLTPYTVHHRTLDTIHSTSSHTRHHTQYIIAH